MNVYQLVYAFSVTVPTRGAYLQVEPSTIPSGPRTAYVEAKDPMHAIRRLIAWKPAVVSISSVIEVVCVDVLPPPAVEE